MARKLKWIVEMIMPSKKKTPIHNPAELWELVTELIKIVHAFELAHEKGTETEDPFHLRLLDNFVKMLCRKEVKAHQYKQLMNANRYEDKVFLTEKYELIRKNAQTPKVYEEQIIEYFTGKYSAPKSRIQKILVASRDEIQNSGYVNQKEESGTNRSGPSVAAANRLGRFHGIKERQFFNILAQIEKQFLIVPFGHTKNTKLLQKRIKRVSLDLGITRRGKTRRVGRSLTKVT